MGVLARKQSRRLLAAAAVVVAGVLAWQAYSSRAERYVAGQETEGLTDALGRALPEDAPRVRFSEVAAEAGLAFRHFPATRSGRLPEDMGSGVALGDVDGDGWTDVFLANLAGTLEGAAGGFQDPAGRSRLFRNLGDGRFEDVTDASGIELAALANGAAFCDVDADGDLDLFVTTYGRCLLYANDGRGRFTDVSAAAGLEELAGFWTGIAVGDYDRDEALDLYVCGYVRYDEEVGGAERLAQYGVDIPARINPSSFAPERNLLLRGRGDGTFEEVAAALGVDNLAGRSLGAVLCDLTGDGWPDLYVANDVSDNAFFVGRGDGTFADFTTEALVGDYRGAMGLAAADFDADLDLDLYITHWVAQENALYVAFTPPPVEGQPATFPRFMDSADRYGLGYIALDMVGWATRFFDYDLDGRLDLFVVNGSTIPLKDEPAKLEPMRSQLFWNAGGKRGFYEVGALAGPFFTEKHVGRGGASFDYDLDGDEDLVVVLHGEPVALLRNECATGGGALRVRLRQPTGNTYALGARATLTVGARRALDVLGTQGSYLSQHAVGELAFGLGGAPQADALELVWPDGERETAGPFPADSLVTWVRGEAPRVERLPGLARGEALGRLATSKTLDVEAQKRFYAVRKEANAARLAGEHERALAGYREALELWPDHEDCLYYLGNSLVELGREREALEAFARLVEVAPASSRGWMQMGALHLPGGDPELDDLTEAARCFTRSHEINGEESGPVVQLGLCAMLEEDLPRAAEHFADAARLNSRSVEARYYGGRVAWLRGDAERARALLEEAHAIAAGLAGKGDSVSGEGDTKSGAAMTAEGPIDAHELLERWRTIGERPADPALEYGGSAAAQPPR